MVSSDIYIICSLTVKVKFNDLSWSPVSWLVRHRLSGDQLNIECWMITHVKYKVLLYTRGGVHLYITGILNITVSTQREKMFVQINLTLNTHILFLFFA